MVAGFVGRQDEMRLLDAELDQVRATGRGRLVMMRGRRQVGKSRLLSEWLRRTPVPAAFHTASRRPPGREVELFAREVAGSDMSSAAAFGSARPADWDDALSLLATTHAGPAVVVVDEFPYLVGQDPSVEATFQKLWDRRLAGVPVLLVLVGSDLAMMESLTSYDRPLFGRPDRILVVDPLRPVDVADMLGVEPAEAIDLHLICGGFPGLIASWPRQPGLREVVDSALADPGSPLVVMGERSLVAEFPPDAHARRILDVIGSGRRTFRTIADRVAVSDATLTQALSVLVDKKVVVVEDPLSTAPTRRLRRYRVADDYLRFWLRFIGPRLADVERGRADLVSDALWSGWSAYRGLAVEPLVRAAIQRCLPDARFGDARRVGSWWNRAHDTEIDLVGLPDAVDRLAFVGSVKWRDNAMFDDADARALASTASVVPGRDDSTLLVGVSRSGFATSLLDVGLGPADLVR